MDAEILVDHEKCTGCNKCIYVCPVKANIAKYVNGGNKVVIDTEKCILCGKCIKTCDHEARDYTDDTERFINDLKHGQKISIIAAPSIRMNFGGNYERLFGLLKRMGVAGIYDVSFGADITTWAYLKAYSKGKKSMIAQPCPVIVDYIQKYNTDLLDSLAPVHSPAMCAAVYLKEYDGVREKLAFLSPCISKSREFHDKNTKGYVEYNVTFAKLQNYIRKNNINLNQYEKTGFDGEDCGLGLLYSRPGGLRENVRFYAGDKVWVRQVEGTTHATKYVDRYAQRISQGKDVPQLVDILNCENGCNIGTGTFDDGDIDEIDLTMNQLKTQKSNGVSESERKAILENFDRRLDPSKFTRLYTANPIHAVEPDAQQIEQIFQSLGKETAEDRSINCFSCGYGNCLEFAKAVARGENHINNCTNYSRHELLLEKEVIVKSCESVKAAIDVINESNEQNISEISEIAKSSSMLSDHSGRLKESLVSMTQSAADMKTSTRQLDDIARETKLIALNALIEAAHAGTYGVTFGIVANEVRDLAQKSSVAVDSTKASEHLINEHISSTNELFDGIDHMVDEINTNIGCINEHIAAVDEKCKNVCGTLDDLLSQNNSL